jgi:PAS domain S-box-containing protein/diguanylate cyclase (GGDEF)-like protein
VSLRHAREGAWRRLGKAGSQLAGSSVNALIVARRAEDAAGASERLRRRGMRVRTAPVATAGDFRDVLSADKYELVCVDPRDLEPTVLEGVPLDQGDPPIVLVGGSLAAEDVAAWMRGGANDYVSPEELPQAAERALELADRRRAGDPLAAAGGILWEADARTLRFTFVSRHAEKVLGYPVERWLSGRSSWGDHIHPHDRERTVAEAREAVRSGEALELEYRAVAADGHVIWMRDVVRGGDEELRGVMLDVTRRALVEQEVRFHSQLLDQVDAAVIAVDLKRTVTHWSRYAEIQFGWTRDEVIGRDIAELAVMDDPGFATAKMEALRSGRAFEGEFRARHKSGRPFACYTRDAPIRDEDGTITGFVGISADISDRKNAERAIAESERRFRRLVEQAADGFLVFDVEGNIVDANAGATRSLGYTREELLQLNLRDVDAALSEDALGELCSEPARGQPVTVETVYRRRDGTTFPVEVRSGLLDAGGEPLFLALARDISERKRAEEQIAYLSRYDSITGLPNRELFEEHLELALSRARRTGAAVAVLYIDLDRFHLVNESLGRAAGDELLRQAASRLREVARTLDLVGRHGADEFLMLLPDIEMPSQGNGSSPSGPEAVAEEMAARVYEALEEPFEIHDAESFIGATIGISVFPSDAGYSDDLIDLAGAALHEVRRSDKGGWGVFKGDSSRRRERLSFGTRLRRAIQRSEFVLHYQPVVDLPVAVAQNKSGVASLRKSIVGVEALIRWQDPERGVIPPGEFIPVAEDMGLIQPIADWVVKEACRQSRSWLDAGWPLHVAFNLSPRQLGEPDLVERMLRNVQEAGVPREQLMVEVTESAAMTDSQRTEEILCELRGHGFRLALDDFGAGHSSLARLGALPADILKIDRSFVMGLPDDRTSAMMVTAIVQLAGNLGMLALAEGIETEEQLEFLVASGCRLGQGFLFSRPVPPPEVELL